MPDMSSIGISSTSLSVVYNNGSQALHDVNFTVPKGSITALVGVNGAGKSTLFKALMGLTPLHAGQVEILGLSVKQALHQNLVSYVPQSEEVDWSFPVLVEDVVMMGRYGQMNFLRLPSAQDRQLVCEALERVDMLDYRHQHIGALSGGQKKRVFLARALAQQAQVIMLDEPFTGVDVRTEEAMIATMKYLRDQNKVLLVSTHNLGSVPEYCDRTILIKRTILASGSTTEVFTPANLERAFGGSLRHFVLGGTDLHDDEDARQVTVISDDERPFVLYDNRAKISDTAPTKEG